jgi:hypothetical protein
MLPYNAKHAEGRPFAREQPMQTFDILWDLDDDPEGNVQHIAEHGITVVDVEEVLSDPDASIDVSKSSGRSIRSRSVRHPTDGIWPWSGRRLLTIP